MMAYIKKGLPMLKLDSWTTFLIAIFCTMVYHGHMFPFLPTKSHVNKSKVKDQHHIFFIQHNFISKIDCDNINI